MPEKHVFRIDLWKPMAEQIPPELEDGLADLGWHRPNDCVFDEAESPGLLSLVGELHRQAHPGERADPVFCRKLPCRDVVAEVLRPFS